MYEPFSRDSTEDEAVSTLASGMNTVASEGLLAELPGTEIVVSEELTELFVVTVGFFSAEFV